MACVLTNSRHEQKNKHCEQPIYYRDMSHFKKDDFFAELQRLMTEFLDTITLNTTDETEINFKNFVSVFKAYIDKHASLKPASRKKRRLLTKPWITNEILDQIKQKQKLYITHYVQGTEEQKRIYKRFANKLTKKKKMLKNNIFKMK